MELYLIRHGQSANNAVCEEQRVEDPALTVLGHRQAACVASWIKSARLTRLIASPFRRALQTTEHIRLATGLTPEVWVELHEQGGCMRGGDPAEYQGQPGMSSREICDEFPGWQLPEELDHRGWWKSKPYENTEGAEFRAKRLALRTRQELGLTDDHVAYVFHGTFKQFFIGALFGVSVVEQSWLGDVRNSGVTRVSITPESTRLEFYNAVGHLPASLIT